MRKIIYLLAFILTASMSAQESKNEKENDSTKKKKIGLPLKVDRKIKLNTDEGTWMSLDISPDGKTLAFDMLGDIYTLPIEGGKASRITSGLAFDSHPKFSPDGKQLLMVSDRTGGPNAWVLDLENGDSIQITKGDDYFMETAEWTNDGE